MTGMGSCLSGRLDRDEVLFDPVAEIACLDRVLEDEHRGALHSFFDHGSSDAPACGEKAHATVITCDERAFGSGERNVEIALRLFAQDVDGPGQADGDLRDANEVLNVAGK